MNTSAKELEFDGQKRGEEMIFLLRRHPIVFWRPALMVILLLLIMILVLMRFWASAPMGWIWLIALVIIGFHALKGWFTWWNTVYVLTNERIITVHQSSWFNRAVGEASLQNVLFINHEVRGFFRTILNYGNVFISSSGATASEMIIKDVADPYGVQQAIVAAQNRYLKSR